MSEWQYILDEPPVSDPNDIELEFEITDGANDMVECYVTKKGITVRFHNEGIQLHIRRSTALTWADNLQLASSISQSMQKAWYEEQTRHYESQAPRKRLTLTTE